MSALPPKADRRPRGDGHARSPRHLPSFGLVVCARLDLGPMAETNKSLAHSNKSGAGGKTTKKRTQVNEYRQGSARWSAVSKGGEKCLIICQLLSESSRCWSFRQLWRKS